VSTEPVNQQQNEQQTSNAELINQQLAQLIALETIIDSEKEILQRHVPENLTEITETKNQQLLAIEILDKKLSQSRLFKQEKTNGLYSEELSEIETILIRCKEKNQINGQLIEHSQLAVERMKTSLLQENNKSSMTYDNKGKTHGGLSSLDIKA